LFGFSPDNAPAEFEGWLQQVFADDALKIRQALEIAQQTCDFYVEFRVKVSDAPLHWLAGKGRASADGRTLRGTFYDVNERKQLEARLLSANETLEARLAELREEARALEVLNRTGIAVGAELNLERLVQTVTDAGVELSGAQFGAFFYNVTKADGESYTLYALSGAARDAFAQFPMPRNTKIFEPTFRGTGVVRSPDILADPRYGQMEPYPACRLGIFRCEVIWRCQSSRVAAKCWVACSLVTLNQVSSLPEPNESWSAWPRTPRWRSTIHACTKRASAKSLLASKRKESFRS
jgi:hypothetical protein